MTGKKICRERVRDLSQLRKMPSLIVGGRAPSRIAVRLKALESEQSTMESLIEQARREVMDLFKTWKDAGLKQRQELQRVVFPEGLVYSMETAFFASRNHSIMQDLEDIYRNWRTDGVPGLTQFAPFSPENHSQLSRLQAFLERFSRPASDPI
jgi:hypothetical protein